MLKTAAIHHAIMDIPRPVPHKVEALTPLQWAGGAISMSKYLAGRYEIGLLPSEFI